MAVQHSKMEPKLVPRCTMIQAINLPFIAFSSYLFAKPYKKGLKQWIACMLVEFSVQNHRAFRERQTFSMVASAATERTGQEHVAHTGFSAIPFVLREACLFGANGSGKSSLIDAMRFMTRFVRNSFRNEPDKGIDVEPFVFHSEWLDKPSEFEIIFIHEETQYQYGFSLTSKRVVEEWLFARPKSTGRQRHLFTRSYDEAKDDYDWEISTVHLKGERESWKDQTRPDALFLSTAVQLKAEGLKEVHEWLVKSFRTYSASDDTRHSGFTQTRFEDDAWKARVTDFLKQADIALADITVEEKKLVDSPNFANLPKPFQEMIKTENPEAKEYDIKFFRYNECDQPVALPLREESTGTKNLFDLAGPILDVLENGWTLIIDELNSGLHPLAFQHLIGMFCDSKVNTKDAQLIFTTHDTSVTERSCIGRDQIWLVEKNEDLAARLVPFSDFRTRDARPFQKGYLQGRYGAVPRITE